MKLAATQKGLCFGLALLGTMVLPFYLGAAAHAQPVIPIYDIQGAGHISSYRGQSVTTRGVVTAVAFNGYYVQDPVGDGNDATSDGIFVRKFGSKPSVGDFVELTGTVTESIPGGAGTGNLSITRMSDPAIRMLPIVHPLPAPSRSQGIFVYTCFWRGCLARITAEV